ncbi:MAG: hypothetical protein HC821_05720 [Lewinella sp.]|nr:hypothetical protein [Lewinella sp.]
MGILGARGNNAIGIAGTSWATRLMVFRIQEISDIIAAYDYVLEQRRLWQSSGGQAGALVVATNASFGLEGRFCREFPVWGNMYEALGQAGVLSVASAANRAWNVDDFGDMPTTCTSEFLLGVANSDENDLLFRSSAWGPVSIDLAAPGQGSYTTRTNGTYGGSVTLAQPLPT